MGRFSILEVSDKISGLVSHLKQNRVSVSAAKDSSCFESQVKLVCMLLELFVVIVLWSVLRKPSYHGASSVKSQFEITCNIISKYTKRQDFEEHSQCLEILSWILQIKTQQAKVKQTETYNHHSKAAELYYFAYTC